MARPTDVLLSLASLPLRLLLAVLGLGFCLLPRRAEIALGSALGRGVLALGLFRHRIAAENMRLCFPEKTPAERDALLRANFAHYGVLFLEYLHFFSPLPGHYARYARSITRVEGLEHWRRAHAKGKGVIFFSAHMGFWEMSGVEGGKIGMGPMAVITTVKPRWLHELMERRRLSTGVRAAYRPGSMAKVLANLREGGTVGFLNDQYARPPMGEKVPFFGALVDTLTVVGPLAKRTGAPVLPVHVHRDADGWEVVVVEPELDVPADGAAAAALICARVESWVRAHPEQWLWLHRRFKNAVWPAPSA